MREGILRKRFRTLEVAGANRVHDEHHLKCKWSRCGVCETCVGQSLSQNELSRIFLTDLEPPPNLGMPFGALILQVATIWERMIPMLQLVIYGQDFGFLLRSCTIPYWQRLF